MDLERLPAQPDAVAPDGSDVRVLLGVSGGGLAHFELAPGETSTAVRHRTVEAVAAEGPWRATVPRGPAAVTVSRPCSTT
jgi:hypothetical protein